MTDEPENLTLRLLREIREEVHGLRREVHDLRHEVHEEQQSQAKTLSEVKRAVVGIAYLGGRLAGDLRDHERRIGALEARDGAT
jgi:ubiquinone biosynthesis protein UbiJ